MESGRSSKTWLVVMKSTSFLRLPLIPAIYCCFNICYPSLVPTNCHNLPVISGKVYLFSTFFVPFRLSFEMPVPFLAFNEKEDYQLGNPRLLTLKIILHFNPRQVGLAKIV